jgi:hypothetical protein
MSKTTGARRRALLTALLTILVLPVFACGAEAASEVPGDTFAASAGASDAFPADGVGQEVSISGDGRYVAFLSSSPDLDPEATTWAQAYVKDLDTGALVLASRGEGEAGPPADEPAGGSLGVERPRLSGNGRYLVFESEADNLVAGMPATPPFPRHVYRRNLGTGETVIADRVTGPSGAIVPIDARVLSASPDGRYVVFSDLAEDLEDPFGAHAEGNETIYVRDLEEGTTVAVDRADGPAGALADTGAEEGAISNDGRYVLFTSAATNLDPEANGIYQVYRRDLQTGQTLLVSRSAPQGEPADGESFEATFVGDSDCIVAFLGSGTTNLDPDAGAPTYGIYLRNFCTLSPTTTLISVRPDGKAFDEAVAPIATSNGLIGFMGSNPFPETRHFYLRDEAGGPASLVDRAAGTEGEAAQGEVEWDAIAANGCRAAFTSASDNLLGEGVAPTGKTQAYVRQLAACAAPGGEGSLSTPGGPSDSGGNGQTATATHLRIARLNRGGLVLSFSGPGTAAVRIRGLVTRPRRHWKLVEKLVESAGEAGTMRLGLQRLRPGRYRIRVRLQGSPDRALVRALKIERRRHSNTLRAH